MRILLVLLALLASTTSLPTTEEAIFLPGSPIDASEFFDPNHVRVIAEPAVFPADPEEFFELVKKAVNVTELIFGGGKAQAGQFPQQAFLSYQSRKGGYYICGASLLSPTIAVTAGHCTYDMVDPAKIMVGATNLRDRSANAQWRNIHRISTNSLYHPDDQRIRSDIGIVEFSPAVTLNRDVAVTKIVADDSQLLQLPSAYISGYGTYTYNGDQSVSSQDLLWTEVQLYNFNYCQQRWRSLDPAKNQICAGSKGRGTGPGDSGGPIQVSYKGQLYQVGLTSFGSANIYNSQYNQDRFPPVFTRLSSYCDFINQYTRGAVSCGSVGDSTPGGGGGPGCTTPPPPPPTRPPTPPDCNNNFAVDYLKGLQYI